ncbi:MerR family transcriptional regulator [Stenotrophomonas sp. NPDC087984]
MRISQLAERTGVPATTLRFYDDAGLLSAGRSPIGYRLYGEDAVARLTFIGAAKPASSKRSLAVGVVALGQTT